MRAQEWRGKWWQPGNPDDKVSGTLLFKPGDPPVLHTIGRFRKPVTRTTEGTIILGSTTNGEVTLFRCSDSWSSLPEAFAELPSEWEYPGKFVLSGHHFERPQDIAFSKFALSINGIEDWSIGGRFVVVPDPPPGVTHVVQYSQLPDIAATVGDYAITMRDFAMPHIDLCREGRATRDPYFGVESAHPVSLEALLNGPVIGLHNFVAFGLGMPVAVKWLRVRPTAHPDRLVDVYFRADEPPEPGFRRSDEMLFTFADIIDDFEPVVRRWFELAEKIAPILDLYFSTLYGEMTMRPNHEFLSLAQALESYHREIYPALKLIPDDLYGKVYNAISASLPTDLTPDLNEKVQKLREKINNDVSLAARLEYLLDQAPPSIMRHAIPDRDDFANRVKHTRNYFTHWSSKPSRKWVTFGINLLHITKSARWLLEALLLGQLGLSADRVEALLARNERLKRARTWTPLY